jgi:lysophospholipase L1-like esterase
MPHSGLRSLLLCVVLGLVGGCAAGKPGASAGRASTPAPADLPPLTIRLAGDSTVMSYPSTTTQEGWGQELGQFFNDKVTIDNQAQGGASVKTFQAGGRWKNILSAIKPGDYVLIQFGANDSGTVPGRHVDPADYTATLELMADEVRARQGNPIFVTPTAFYQWRDGKQDNARLAPYAAAALKAGAGKNVPVVDLNARGAEHLNTIGQSAATPLFFPNRSGEIDKAHFLKPGAVKNAQLVAGELRRLNSPLAAYLK